jgi:hypothetical protein
MDAELAWVDRTLKRLSEHGWTPDETLPSTHRQETGNDD